MHIHCKINVCVDCYYQIGLGLSEQPDSRWTPEKCETGMEPGVHYSPGDADKDHEFSWAQCQLCRTYLGGSRHEIIGLCSHDGCADNYRDEEEDGT